MKKTYWLKLELQSDAAFSRGDGIAGVVDEDVQHDEHGLPYLGGKTLKGLLTAACAEVLAALTLSNPSQVKQWQQSAEILFGAPGSQQSEVGWLHVGDALLPEDLREAIIQDIRLEKLAASTVLESLTALRHQTAIDAETGAPLRNSLRTIRVILRETVFISRLDLVPPLSVEKTLSQEEEANLLALLSASVKAFRRAGAHRNRGLGKLITELYDEYPIQEETVRPVTPTLFENFIKEVQA